MEKDTTYKDASTDSAPLTSQKLYTELGSDDVLLGRGTGPNEFEGNIRFRRLVGEVAMATDPKGLLSNKPVLARRVVDEVANRGGRFVRKLSKGEVLAVANITPINRRKDMYVEVPHAVAIEKAKQSFRHQEKVLLDRRDDPSRAKKGVVAGALFLKSPPTLSIKDGRLLPMDKHSRGEVGIKPNDNVERRSNVGSSIMKETSDSQASIERRPLRSEHSTVSLPSSSMEYSNILSQSHALQGLPTNTNSLLRSAQQQLSGPHHTTSALASVFPLLRHGILDPSSLLYTSQPLGPTPHTSNIDLLNEVSQIHELTSLLVSQETRIPDGAIPQQEQPQSQATASLLQLLQEYYSPRPGSLSSRAPLAATSMSAGLPQPPWPSSALLQNTSLAFGLMGGGGPGGASLPGASIDYALSSSILQQHLQHQQHQQLLLASLGGALGRDQESSGGGIVERQQAGASSGGGDGGVLDSGTDSPHLAAAGVTARMVTTAPAPLSQHDGTNTRRWQPFSSDHSSTPAETERNEEAADQQQQESRLLEYILRLRRPG